MNRNLVKQTGRYLVRGALSSILIVLSVPPLAAQPASADGLRRAEPIRCTGVQRITLRDRTIETAGDAVVVNGQCRVELENCLVVAGGVGLEVQGMGQVVLERTTVEGGRAAVHASGKSRVTYRQADFRGAVLADGMAQVEGDGDVVAQSSPGSTEARVRFGAGGIRLETGTGESVSVGARGIELQAGDASVEIDADDFLRLLPDVGVEVSADWRAAGGTVRSADVERLLGELGARVEAGEVRLALGGDVLFDFSSAVVRPQAAAELAKLAQLIRARSAGMVEVVGHTDSIGSDSANQKLSELRAIAVMRWLRDQEGIPVEVMRGRGLGATKPVAYNTLPDGSDNPEGRARNRRVEIAFANRP